MVEATQVYHPKVLRTIDALMRYYALQAAKDRIRARNQRVTDYDPRDISAMARALLLTKPEHFVERSKASAVVKDVEAKLAAQAARKAQRKTVTLYVNLSTALSDLLHRVLAAIGQRDHAQKPSPKRIGQRQISLKGSGDIAV